MRKFKILMPALCILCVLQSKAQFSRGTIMLGTTIGSTAYLSSTSNYNYDNGSEKSNGTNTYTFSMGPQVGVFLTPHFVLGASLSYNLSTSHATSTTTSPGNSPSGSTTNSSTSTVTAGPLLRYYFAGLPFKNWFYLQANGTLGTGSGSSSGTSYNSTTTGTTSGSVTNIFTWNAGSSVGMTHFFYKHIGMDIALGYNYSHSHNYNINNTNTVNKTTGNMATSANNYSLNTGTGAVTLGVGFHWFI
jgi:hypothetical protein